jgi:hypothetical protein
MNYRYYQIKIRVKHRYTNRELCEVSIGYLSLWRQRDFGWNVLQSLQLTADQSV